MDLRVSPNLAPSSGTASASSERSESCVYGWADDDFPARLELCIPGPRPWMNLRVQSGLARSCSALDAFSISFGFLLPQPTAVSDCRFQFNPASSCLPGTAFPIPCKVTNWMEIRLVQSVDTSAKRDETCGFHHAWCINRCNSF